MLRYILCALLAHSVLFVPELMDGENYPLVVLCIFLAIVPTKYPFLTLVAFSSVFAFFDLSPLLTIVANVAIALASIRVLWPIMTTRSPVRFNVKLPKNTPSSTEARDEAPILNDGEKAEKMPLTVSSRPGKIQCWSPTDSSYLGQVDIMDDPSVRAAVDRAREAQLEWKKSSFDDRLFLLRTLQHWILNHQDEIAEIACRDSGKLKVDAIIGEIMPTCEKIAWTIRDGKEALVDDHRKTGPGLATLCKRGWVEYRPVGVLGIIAPWNYPFTNFMNHIISGLFSGNAVVVKPSEFTSWSGQYFLDIVREALRATGVGSPDLVQLITGLGDTGSALVSRSGVDKIIFTGSAKVGKLVMRGASAALTPVVLELGGKDPAVVCDDANLNRVVPVLLRGSFQNSGQNCAGIERIFAHEKVHDKIISQAAPIVKNLRLGVDYGAIATPMQLQLINDLVEDARKKGASVVAGGSIKNHPGLYFEPTLLTGVTKNMRIVKEEVFGPVMLVMKFTKDDEMLKTLNNTEFGLGCSAFSGDYARAKKIVNNIDAGFGNINDFGLNYMMQSLPFGGIKHSGFGRFAGIEGLRACCYAKAVTNDRVTFIQTWLPKQLQYPIQPVSESFGKALVRLSYAETPLGFISALISMIRASPKKK